MFLKKIGLDDTVTRAERKTRLNGKVLENATKNQHVGGGGHWKMGLERIKLEGGNYHFLTWTVENSAHVTNFDSVITPDGKVIEGRVNCFALGWMDLDQEYLEELIDVYDGDVPKWD